MSNIVGEGFPEQIIGQVKRRQTIYGLINRNSEQLTYLNGRTSWCKLVSSVNVKTPLRNISLLESDLAKQFVLFNGTTNESTNVQRAGVWPGTGNSNDYAYGMGGTEFGLRPMPGVKSASTKTETRGSLRTSTIQIQANNREQFDIIDVLYMRLGFTMLLEWGNSSYFTNDGVYENDNPHSLADKFLEGTLNYENASKLISETRLSSYGNYDAVVGKVVNFNWTFTKDGTYDITLTLRSMGDVLESLKSNLLLPNSSITVTPSKDIIKAQENLVKEQARLTQAEKEIEDGKNKVASYDIQIADAEKALADLLLTPNPDFDTKLAAQQKISSLQYLRNQVNDNNIELNQNRINKIKEDREEEKKAVAEETAAQLAKQREEIAEVLSEANPTSEDVIKAFSLSHEVGKYFYQQQVILSELSADNAGVSVNPNTPINFFKQVYEGDDTTYQFYIRLGHFLEWMQENLVPKVQPSNTPLIKIDYETEQNIIYLLGRQLSTNPGICVFKTKFIAVDGSYTTEFAPGVENFRVSLLGSKNTYGKIMNSYFNMTYILKQMDSLKDEDGRVPLYDLIKSLCDGWNNATGNFSKLGVSIDADTNEVKIIDEVSLPDRDKWLNIFKEINPTISTELVTFDVYGYYYPLSGPVELTSAGFIKDIKFNTTITPNLATMITVGATSNGYVVGQDATALSAMNAGLEDRFKEKIENKNNNNTVGTASLNESFKTALNDFNTFVRELGSQNGKVIPTWNQEAINSFASTAVQFYEYDQAKQTLGEKGEINPSAVALGQQTSSLKPLKQVASPNGGFLPFDLTVTMDGLSGMKVYQKYTIDTNYLPSNYPNTLEFLIKGITNDISNNQWTTTLESFAIPKNPFGSTISETPTSSASSSSSSLNALSTRTQDFSTRGGSTSRTIEGAKYENGKIPESKLRVINNDSKYRGAVTSDNGRIRLYVKASIALDRLILAAEQANIPIKINSAYRTFSDQQRVYSTNCPGGVCNILTATPGRSNHGFGVAVDFANPQLKRIKSGDKLYNWLTVNGAKFGFKRIASETWHWEYQI
jgi:LAS superfamily LD-carboxypeptidase LdcB